MVHGAGGDTGVHQQPCQHSGNLYAQAGYQPVHSAGKYPGAHPHTDSDGRHVRLRGAGHAGL